MGLDVVSGKTVDTGLDENHSELGVLVGTVTLEVLSDSDGLFDEVVEVLWDGGAETWNQHAVSTSPIPIPANLLRDISCRSAMGNSPACSRIPPQ